MQVLGIDIGGSGIKGALVNTKTGELLAERHRISTPQPATPNAVAETVAALVEHFNWQGPIGCGFPAIVLDGVVKSAANISEKWLEVKVEKLLSKATNCKVKVVNDADAAGFAEAKFGVGKNRRGAIFLVTVGTGLGTCLVVNGKLVPNTEFGHVLLHGMIAEQYASDATRKREDLSWQEWAERFSEYLEHMCRLLSPNLIVLGGGASKKQKKWGDYLKCGVEVVTAQLRNEAGIIGAALAAASESDTVH